MQAADVADYVNVNAASAATTTGGVAATAGNSNT